MIDIHCDCGTPLRAAEAEANLAIACPSCHKTLRPVSAEQLPDGAGAADFDTRLVVTEGPAHVGEHLLLGGCMEIELGKQPERHISLAGKMVSRNHCKLVRLDFGPSRWKLVDNKSTNGCFVNGTRVYDHELRDGDTIKVGDYMLRFVTDASRPAPAPVKAIPVGGPTCPSCNQPLPPNTKICVECGIYIDTGKPLVLSKGFDEDSMAETSDTWIRIVSWVIPIGLFPVASEAYGTRKAYVTWVITVLTILTSLAFFPVIRDWGRGEPVSAGAMNLMHWSGSREAAIEEYRADVEAEWAERNARLAAQTAQAAPGAKPAASPGPTKEQIEQWLMDEEILPPKDVGFRWYQLFTHAMLHGDLFHLAGNLLFLLVFGMRVNELIGNIAAAIVYPVLAVGSALIDGWVHADGALTPGLGASGAIMGLAGMYFILFPMQKVHMAIWARWFWLFIPLIFYVGLKVSYKMFVMGGFWLLLLWVGFNDILPTLIGSEDQVAHWAHLGGFMVGMALALGLLLARVTNARGGDLLSVTLGKRAWALVGKPSTRKDPPATPRAVSLNYGG